MKQPRKATQPAARREDPIQKRSSAVRKFFTQPKAAYTVPELEVIFGSDIPDVCRTLDVAKNAAVDHRTAATFVKSYVSPAFVGQALDGIDSPLALERRSIDLPAWLLSAIDQVARSRGWSPAAVIAGELIQAVETGVSSDFQSAVEAALPTQISSRRDRRPRRQPGDAPCSHEGGRCVCLALLQQCR